MLQEEQKKNKSRKNEQIKRARREQSRMELNLVHGRQIETTH